MYRDYLQKYRDEGQQQALAFFGEFVRSTLASDPSLDRLKRAKRSGAAAAHAHSQASASGVAQRSGLGAGSSSAFGSFAASASAIGISASGSGGNAAAGGGVSFEEKRQAVARLVVQAWTEEKQKEQERQQTAPRKPRAPRKPALPNQARGTSRTAMGKRESKEEATDLLVDEPRTSTARRGSTASMTSLMNSRPQGIQDAAPAVT